MTHPSLHAARTPGKIAYRMAGATDLALTYAELDAQSNQAAQLFRAAGVAAGGHIALLLENSPDFMVICWAAQRAGLNYTPISRFLKADEIIFIIADSGAEILIVSPTTLENLDLAALPKHLKLYCLGTPPSGIASWSAALARHPQTPIPDEVAGADMLYSSGTTGRPKGVKPALRGQPIATLNPLLKILGCDMCGMDADTIYLCPAPLYHAAPLRFAMLAAGIGATVIIMEKFDPERFLELIEHHHVTHTQCVPTMFVRLLKLPEETRARRNIASLKGAIHAAAPCPPDVKEAMIAWWGEILLEYYAGTEGNGVTIINSREWLTHRGSVGRPVVGEIKILDPETGAPLPPGKTGNIYFAGGPSFAYHNNPTATAGAHTPEGWSTLGDIGHLDAENYLYLTDRKAYTIISGGVNIYPQETEDILITHPAVLDAAVFGVPDAEMGERVHAVVQPLEPEAAGPALAAELIAHCRSRLAHYKCPRSIDFDPELPRTQTGKLLKRLLKARYWPATP